MVGKRIFSKTFWLSIRDVERLFGRHRSTIRRWMKKGWLPFVLGENRYAWFPRAEIEQLAQVELGRIIHGAPARIAVKAFEMFATGKTWQEVLIALGRDPADAQPVEVVRKLHAQYLEQDRGPSMKDRTPRRPSEPALAPEPEAEELPTLDTDAWCREQEQQAKSAQAALDREEREWAEEQRQREVEFAKRYPTVAATLRPSLRPTLRPTNEEPAGLTDRLYALLQMMGAAPVPG